MNIGPNAQAVVDRLKGRPAEVIAATEDSTQATFRALFNGAMSPGRFTATGALRCGHDDANAGWSGEWNELRDLGLLTYRISHKARKVIVPESSLNANAELHWQITSLGWEVRIDDVAWMIEFRAATEADRATKQ
jgi:hypothetical protein